MTTSGSAAEIVWHRVINNKTLDTNKKHSCAFFSRLSGVGKKTKTKKQTQKLNKKTGKHPRVFLINKNFLCDAPFFSEMEADYN